MQPKRTPSKINRGPLGKNCARWLAFAGIALLVTVVVSTAWSFDDKQTSSQSRGLRGILPDEAPEALSAKAFSALGPNWADWGDNVADLVKKLYEDEELDAAGQRQVIDSLKSKLRVIRNALADDRYQSIFDQLTGLHGALSRRVGTAEAILNTLEQGLTTNAGWTSAQQDLDAATRNLEAYLTPMKNGDNWLKYLQTAKLEKLTANPESSTSVIPVLQSVQRRFKDTDAKFTTVQRDFLDREQFARFRRSLNSYLALARAAKNPSDHKQQLRTKLASLSRALENYETHNSSNDATRARELFRQLRDNSTDALGHISDTMRTNYFNYNLRIEVSEAFINRMISDNRVDRGPVDDFILGAKVDGHQTTNTTVGLDLKPSGDSARFRITLNGVSQTRTQGVTDQATIFTSGYHTFYATKDVLFDGGQFTTQAANISVNANNTTTGARTQVSGFPIFGSIARGIAMDAARDKRTESEAITRQKLANRVIPEFNREVDANFLDANSQMETKVNAPLREMGLYPSAISTMTTEHRLLVRTRLMTNGELAGDMPQSAIDSSEGLVIHLHESLLNNSFDRMRLASRTLTEKELANELEEPLRKILGRDVSFDDESEESGDDDGASFVFHFSDPIRVRINDGTLELTIQAGLKPGDGKEDIPTQIITVPLSFKVEGDNVIIERGAVIVSAVEAPRSQFVQITRAAAVRKKVEAALPKRALDRYISVASQAEGKQPMRLAVSQIKTLDGWLSIVFE